MGANFIKPLDIWAQTPNMEVVVVVFGSVTIRIIGYGPITTWGTIATFDMLYTFQRIM